MDQIKNQKKLSIPDALAMANEARAKGELRLAQNLYNAILKLSPSNQAALDGISLLGLKKGDEISGEQIYSDVDKSLLTPVVQLFREGKLDKAVEQCNSFISKYPTFPPAFNLLGAIFDAQGNTELAIIEFDKALKQNGSFLPALTNKGLALKKVGRTKEALRCFEKIVDVNPDFSNAYLNLGDLLRELKQFAEAVIAYDNALLRDKNNHLVWFKRGASLSALGKLEDSLKSYANALDIQPGYAEAHSNMGNILKKLNRLPEARSSYEQAIRLNPEYAIAHYNLGSTLYQLGEYEESICSFDKALKLNPGFAEAHANRANALKELRKFPEALEGYHEALEIKPQLTHIYVSLGNVQKDLGLLEEALASYDRAIESLPTLAEAHSNKANTLKELGRIEQAIESYRRSLELNPSYLSAYSNLLLCAHYSPDFSSKDRFALAQRFSDLIPVSEPFFENSRTPQDHQYPLRVGFVSGDLRNHPVGFFLESVFSTLDSRKLSLYAYSTDYYKDELSERIEPFFNSWKCIKGINDPDAAAMIKMDKIDVLIDLAGHTGSNRLTLFALKPAAIQITWLGYFATTGLSQIDYFLSDPYLTPAAMEESFSEKIWRLPCTRWCFSAPRYDISPSNLPALNNGFITFGCQNNFSKLNGEVVHLWSQILNEVPDSRLLLKSRQYQDSKVRETLHSTFAKEGIAEERVLMEGWASRKDYLETYNRIDIVLDPFPFTGGTTSVEALWMGVPFITLEGDSVVSRQGVSILHNAGLSDCIANSEADYLAKAVDLASQPHYLSELRNDLRDSILQTPLFNAESFARNFEDAISTIWNERINKTI